MNWTALGVSLSALVLCIGFIAFLMDMRNGLRVLTNVVREVRDEMKVFAKETRDGLDTHDGRLGDHDVLFAKVNTLLDLDDSAQSIIRDRMNRRANIRRSQDQVNEDVREIMRHDRQQEGGR